MRLRKLSVKSTPFNPCAKSHSLSFTMSRFFRSANSSSSSDSEPLGASDDETDDVTENMSLLGIPDVDNAGSSSAVNQPPTSWNIDHRDRLLHALLEERCMNQVLLSYGDARQNGLPRRDAPEIQAEAKARYQRLCAQLAPFNLISTGLEADAHSTTRQRYRDGLDILGEQRSTKTVPASIRRLLTDSDTDTALRTGSSNDSLNVCHRNHQQIALPFQLRRLLTGPDETEQHSRLQQAFAPGDASGTENRLAMSSALQSRYRREFEEISTLGRGGYGIVYQARHRLDNQVYAIKKVPLSATRLQQIQRKGHSELEEVLRELQTLARLDHPNIVRYYNGWVEWVENETLSERGGSHGVGRLSSSETTDAVAGAEQSRSGFVRGDFTKSDAETEILFEDSGITTTSAMKDDPHNDNSSFQLRRVRTKSTIVTVSDEVESIDRDVDPSASIQSAAGGAHFTQPTLAIHIQMSLHPMTLAEFLSPKMDELQGNHAAPTLAHCFHLEPSISILLAVINGLEHLHSEGIVHRDIKPANIFLGPQSNPRAMHGCVDLMLCSDCRDEGKVNPIRLEVRIGDFGLVTVANPKANEIPNSQAVGTEIYRPDTQETRSSSLDIYALGIVAFELLWRFKTRMERLYTIQRLKQGEFPNGFLDRLGKSRSGKIVECIEAMLSNGGSGISSHELKQQLSALQATMEHTP